MSFVKEPIPTTFQDNKVPFVVSEVLVIGPVYAVATSHLEELSTQHESFASLILMGWVKKPCVVSIHHIVQFSLSL